ncbi:uncharacterized protein Aud_002948 [Aspergillus udagawae]|uniref:SET domain-containing protein n=1 Tax=Aspergillus udagawae TaxID=91492 RepID=A0A8E0QKM6_9EURO|nr:uncharacterized protein Aud_002948 [Aspergillus udagawae]GIC86574.1 hypothetical protein Aud_002948 [Aspergillus udagawae]
MMPDWWPGEIHDRFTEWAISQGVIVNGVAPARFPGRGLGMISTRAIEKEEVILTVPLKAMLTTRRIPVSFKRKFPKDISVHALLAAFLTLGDKEDLQKYELWRQTWPTRQDFEDNMPLLWPQSLRRPNPYYDDSASQINLLPRSISGAWSTLRKRKNEHEYETSHQNLLAQQEQRLHKAWSSVVSVFPDVDRETYTYNWLIVNTRSFYYLMPGQKPPEDRNDAMALLPFADYFNHSDVEDDVKFDGQRYVFRATRHYDSGEEIYMSYGPHPNDFLLVEYGFYLDENGSDAIYLDDIIFRDLGASLQEELYLQQYYGNYEVTATGACYRTEIAACLKYMTRRDWRNYALGYSTKGCDAQKSNAIIQEWILAYAKEADTTIAALEALGSKEMDQKYTGKVSTLVRRWKQIKGLCDKASEAVSC